VKHIVLLGDSIFDNGAYVAGGPDVIAQLRDKLPQGWRATLLAIDGSLTGGIAQQLEKLPSDATHLVVSIGGNDALDSIGILEASAQSVADALNRLADIRDRFQRNYRLMLAEVLARKLPAAFCTIYEPRFPEAPLQRVAVTALCLFNDVITREVFKNGLPVLDLRLICDDDKDYANPIEPSVKGGEKISSAILSVIKSHDFGTRRSEIFARVTKLA
jgi:lysophospholipase L1-like esterase